MRRLQGVCISMNNQQKNSYVKQKITEALLSLLEQKSLEDIAVSEITATAQVGRASFYRNYTSKEDVLRQYDRELIREWGQKYESDAASNAGNVFSSLFRQYKENARFYKLLYQCGMTDVILETIKATCGPTPEMSAPEAYSKAFLAYGIYGWVVEWIARGMVDEPEKFEFPC